MAGPRSCVSLLLLQRGLVHDLALFNAFPDLIQVLFGGSRLG